MAYVATLPDYGLVSDEGNYFSASRRLVRWFEYLLSRLRAGVPQDAFTPGLMDETWRWLETSRIPHPPFSREVAGLSHVLFGGWIETLTAYRLLGALLAGGLVGGVAAWGALRGGAVAGITAGLALLLMPRVFAHAHFADTDSVLSALFFAALFCAAEGRRAPMVGAGALWGLALATKFSAILLPAVLIPWLAVFRRPLLRRLPWFGLAALVTFVAVNPAFWVDPIHGLREYLAHGFARSEMLMTQLPTFYFGRVYLFRPPWHYTWVMLLLTLPIGFVLLAPTGVVSGLLRPALRPAAALAALVPAAFLGALALPSAPMHDDVRLFLSVFPFLALLIGFGAATLLRPRMMRVVGPALLVVVLADSLLSVVRLHPYQASYYNALVGGIAGAEARGLEVTTMKEVLNHEVYDDLNGVLPRGATLDGGPFLYEDLLYAQELGWLRRDVKVQMEQPAAYVLIVHRRGWFRQSDLALFHFATPAYAVTIDGVVLAALYRLG
ncbi:MAG: glycosyltransferase family 39 protein [Gemmatimonadota bacterium]